MSDVFNIEHYRVYDIIDPAYDDANVNLIDFTLHLKPEVTLHKKLVKDASGRPIIASYFYGETLICNICFDFEVDTNSSLISRRTETLHYITTEGEESPDILIKDKVFDFSDLNDLEVAMQERESARKSILSKLKGTTIGVIQMYIPSLSSDEVVVLVKDFWNDTINTRSDFIELGDNTFRDFLVAIDLPTTEYTWLSYQIQAGVTLRDYYVSILSY